MMLIASEIPALLELEITNRCPQLRYAKSGATEGNSTMTTEDRKTTITEAASLSPYGPRRSPHWTWSSSQTGLADRATVRGGVRA